MTSRSIAKLLTSQLTREGGGFVIKRSIGSAACSELDPFLLLDHLGPVVYGPGEAIGAPDHPHRGFETVTYILEGGVHHLDNNGNEGNLEPGWVQWMTAGRGIVHSEMPTKKLLEQGGRNEGFQLWVNLPARDKMIAPRYQDTPPEKIPKVVSKDSLTKVAVIAGESMGVKANIDTRTPMMYLDINMEKDGKFNQEVPESYNGFFYVYAGSGFFGPDKVKANEGQYLLLGKKGNEFEIQAGSDGLKGLLIAGEPLNEPVSRYGPFVMNTREEIMQAIRDYQSGLFGKEIDGSKERMKETEKAKKKQKETGKWQEEL